MEPVICRKLLRRAALFTCLVTRLGVLATFPPPVAAQSLEYPVKAAFLLNFTKFIEWQATVFAQPDAPLSICILGDDPFGNTLDKTVTGEVVNGHRVVVQRLTRPPVAKSCQILFISGPEKDIHNIVAEVGPGTLTVGEGENFVHDGGMIAFVIENRRVRFDINQAAAANAGLKLSSQLLKVARSVER
jgi:hypothetical protein